MTPVRPAIQPRRWTRADGRLLVLTFVAAVFLLAGMARESLCAEPQLGRFLPQLAVGDLVPGADRLGPIEGTPPAAPAYAGQELKGWVFLNSDVVNAVGYSGKPIRIAIGIDTRGVITGARLVEHHEPIVLVGIPPEKIEALIARFAGQNVLQQVPSGQKLDIISGATVTVMVIDDSVRGSAQRMARSRAQAAAAAAPAAAGATVTIDATATAPAAWSALLAEGALAELRLTVADVDRALAQAGDGGGAAGPSADPAAANATFIELYAGLVSIPSVGRSLLGPSRYEQMLARQLKPGQQAVLIAGRGRYSWKGSGYVRGGIFDRIALIQGEETIRFRDRNHRRLADLAAEGAPDLPEIGLFTLPDDASFDPTRPWRLQLLVQRQDPGREKAFLTFDLSYSPPEKYLERVSPPPAFPPTPAGAEPAGEVPAVGEASFAGHDARQLLVERIWDGRLLDIAVLTTALLVLTGLFFFQDWFVRRPRLTTWVRYGFLIFTLVWLGWYAKAQLSVVNVLTFSNALLTDFSWSYFLMDPLIFILWFAVAAGLLFWGRGAFCGWLCPFGALQELTNHIGRRLGVPQLQLPWGLNERLWPLKYIIFLGLFGFSLYSLAWAERLSEIEPFKTAIILAFVRSWPFVTFAVMLLVAGLFVERLFCRYLCPLGAALAIPGRLRMFDWLKRWPECGSPCQRCANECPVAAIHPNGVINVHECIYCLDCQKLYHDDHKCPHMIQLRLKRERRQTLASDAMLPDAEHRARRGQPA
jgi:NosR/NirI family nitrous oxide reductase transcriptional regulator